MATRNPDGIVPTECLDEDPEQQEDLLRAPSEYQYYTLLEKKQLSPDSCRLRFDLPRTYLGTDPLLPTCLKVEYPNGKNKHGAAKVLSKSYSPTSHPAQRHFFDLVVKGYPYRDGGGVGAYLCRDIVVPPNDGDKEEETVKNNATATTATTQIRAKLKSHRMVHGSPMIRGRWDHVGLVGGGTGVAPLLQIARLLLESPTDDYGLEKNDDKQDETTTVHLLFINRYMHDILCKDELDEMVAKYHPRFSVTYSLTGGDDNADNSVAEASTDARILDDDTSKNTSSSFWTGRGSMEMIRHALPPSTITTTEEGDSDGNTSKKNNVMIFVCGTDGFVDHWGGPVLRAPPLEDGTKGPKIQGPLLGLLKEAGYDASQVFKY